jgi:negative regulator of sigma E activity
MKKAKSSLVIFLILFLGPLNFTLGQEKNHHSKNIDTILMKMQMANSLIKYQGIMTTILINNPFSEVCRYKIENYGNILRKEELLTNGAEKEIDYDDGKNLWRFFPHKNFLLKETTKIHSRPNNKTMELIDLVKKNYEIKILGEHEINQRTCYKVIFKPKTNDRPQQIFWIDSETGIPFKIEKYGPDNDLVSLSIFSSIEFQVTPNKKNLDFMVPSQTKVVEVNEKFNLTLAEAKIQMGKEISSPEYIPPGFNLKNIIIRSLGSEKTIQFFYTDGLSSFSIFQKKLPQINKTVKTPYGEMVVKEKAAILRSSGTMNILNIHSNHKTTTVMGELFKESILKVGDSLNQDQVQQNPSNKLHSINGSQSK